MSHYATTTIEIHKIEKDYEELEEDMEGDTKSSDIST